MGFVLSHLKIISMKESENTLIVRYLKGEATKKEQEELVRWINANPENRRYFEDMEEAWHASGITGRKQFDDDKAWQKFYASHFIVKSRGSFRSFMKYAAIIAVLITLGWSGHFLYQRLHKVQQVAFMELSVSQGETANFRFADGTRVKLNAGTSIRFPEHFQAGRREVYLTGEAYFQVAKNQERPFIVHTGDLNIKVLGTSFNIRSYPGEGIITTTLEEGKVEVFKPDARDKQKYILSKNQHLQYEKASKKMHLKKQVDTRLYTSWKEGHFKFRGIKLDRLIKSIERLYDVEIEIKHPDLQRLTYTGSFYKSEPVNKVLEMIEMSSREVNVKQRNNRKFIITQKTE